MALMAAGSLVTADEECIIWEEDIDALDYVRWNTTYAGTRRRPVPWRGEGRRVGYAVLTKHAENNTGHRGYFYRRVFFLRDHDRDRQPEGVYATGAPIEAVDPRTVRPGVLGSVTERAWGSPLD